MIFKITDVRVKFNGGTTGSDAYVYVDGLGVGYPLQTNASSIRAALMLQVFDLGRDCYWDDGLKTFMTSTAAAPPIPPSTKGPISNWEAVIPAAANSAVVFRFGLLNQPLRTSGDAAAEWAAIKVDDKNAGVVLALLASKYRFFDNGTLRNTDILDANGNPT